jgi:arginyl-tRNA synthetase
MGFTQAVLCMESGNSPPSLLRRGYNFQPMIRQQLAEWVAHAAHAACEAGDLAFDALPAFEIETPRNPQFGDYAANLAMLLAKQARRNPREVAEAILQHLPDDARAWVERVEVAKKARGF